MPSITNITEQLESIGIAAEVSLKKKGVLRRKHLEINVENSMQYSGPIHFDIQKVLRETIGNGTAKSTYNHETGKFVLNYSLFLFGNKKT